MAATWLVRTNNDMATDVVLDDTTNSLEVPSSLLHILSIHSLAPIHHNKHDSSAIFQYYH